MKGYWKLVVLMVLALAGLLLAVASAWAGPQGAGPAEPMAPAGVVSGTISYQGRLLQGNTPVNGNREITFNLYTQASGGAPLWSQPRDVTVNNGLFNADLTLDPAFFNGQALWLGVQVEGDLQEMSPRQPLLPAPYAFSLRPGAVISANLGTRLLLLNNSDGWGIESHSTNGFGVASYSTNDVAVYGESVNTTAAYFTSTYGVGVHANTPSNSAAVLGVSTGSGNGSAGVVGYSVNGVGVIASAAYGHALRTFGPSLIQGLNSQQVALLRWYPAIQTPMSFTVGTRPGALAFDGANMWIANYGSGTVSVLRANNGELVRTCTVGRSPTGIAYDGANMWVTNGDDSNVNVLRASDCAHVMTPTVGDLPSRIAFDGTNMWVANNWSHSVSVLRASDGYHVMTPTVSTWPVGLAFDGSNMWVTTWSGSAHVLSGINGAHVMTLTVGGSNTDIAFDGANMWVASMDDDSIYVLRASDGVQVRQVVSPTIGDGPSSIAFDGANMWVVNELADTVSVLRAANGAPVATFPVGDRPVDIAFDGANMWISNNWSNTVSKR